AALVISEDRVRDYRRRRKTVLRVDHHLDAVGAKYFQRAAKRRLGQRVGVDADEQRPVDAGALPVLAQRLADGENVRLVEGVVERRAAMPRGAERDALR